MAMASVVLMGSLCTAATPPHHFRPSLSPPRPGLGSGIRFSPSPSTLATRCSAARPLPPSSSLTPRGSSSCSGASDDDAVLSSGGGDDYPSGGGGGGRGGKAGGGDGEDKYMEVQVRPLLKEERERKLDADKDLEAHQKNSIIQMLLKLAVSVPEAKTLEEMNAGHLGQDDMAERSDPNLRPQV